MVRTTISLPESLFAVIKKEAEKQKISVSKFIAKSLEKMLILEKKKAAAESVLELVKKKPLSSEAFEEAIRELEKLKKEWKL